MHDIPWDSPASLMRVVAFATTDAQEDLVARGILRDLVGTALGMSPADQRGLLLRASGPDWTRDYDADTIRELAARPDFTGAHGAFDTADLPGDPQTGRENPVATHDGPTGTHPDPTVKPADQL